MRFTLSVITIIAFVAFLPGQSAQAQNLQAVQIYTDNQLLDLIKENKHLSQVVLDECQLVEDIKARATKAKLPSYQFLWGDMLAYGVCIKKDVKLGLYYMQSAADQGLPEALEQMGRYYHVGKFMQPDLTKAITFLKAAAASENLNAQLRLADIYNEGEGSPLDFPALYSQLHYAVTDDKKLHKRISQSLAKLAEKMPAHVVAKAKRVQY